MAMPLSDLADRAALVEWLRAAQLSAAESRRKGRLFGAAVDCLLTGADDDHRPAWACFVPGRIEVLGKHTDYAGGRSLICAAERGLCAVGVARNDAIVTMTDAARDDTITFPLAPDVVPRLGHWSNYPMTVARRLARNFTAELHGIDIALASDLPPAAGMSSSSALIIATYLLLARANRLSEHAAYRANIHNDLQLGEYLGTIENGQSYGSLVGDRGVGTFGGSEDHTAILGAQAGKLGQFSYCPTRHERWVDMSSDFVFAIGVSGVVAEKTGAAMQQYNQAALRAGAVAELWRQATGRDAPHMAAIVAGTGAAEQLRRVLESHRHPHFTPEELIDRCYQFVVESEEIIPAVPDRLTPDNVAQFGQLVHRSQSLGAGKLRNQVPETVWLAAAAEHLGAAAASAFGAGFGGSVWALIAADRAESFITQWQARYAKEFPQNSAGATFFTTRPGPAASFLGEP